VAHRDVQAQMVTFAVSQKPVRAVLQALASAYDLKLELQPDTGIYMLKLADAKSESSRVVRVGDGTSGGGVPSRTEVVLPPQVTPTVRRPGEAVGEPAGRPLAVRAPHLETGAAKAGGTARELVRESIRTRFVLPSDIASWLGGTAITTDAVGRERTYRPQVNVPTTSVNLGDTINGHDNLIKRSTGERYRLDPRYNPAAALYARDQFGGGFGDDAGDGGGGAGGGAGGGLGGAVFELPEGIEEIVGYDLISALIVRGDPDAIQDLRDLVEMLDQPPQQIEVEARFVTLSVNDAESFGMSWTLTDGTSTISGSTPGQGGASVAFQYATGNFQTLITAITRDNKGKVVNAPKVATQNGQPAVVQFQQTIPVTISDTVVTDASSTVSTSIETIPVTTMLLVVPRVTGTPPNESITTVIVPQVADVIGFVDNPSGGTIPIVAQQTIQTTLRVPNGGTIALGGLIRKNNSESSTKIPFLGDLPFIGQLFRSKTQNVDESELLIFITPRILREPGLSGPAPVR
jgi:type II secretory pathway component GspD/PulD (secretin)